MERLVREGMHGVELVSVNRAQKKQEALFLSDIATANGRKINPIYLTDWTGSLEGQLGQHRLVFEYDQECPTDEEGGLGGSPEENKLQFLQFYHPAG